jgi:hypothetical protein
MDFTVTTNDSVMACVLFDLIYNSRKEIERRYEFTEEKDTVNLYSDGVLDGIDLMYKKLHTILEKHNVDIDDIVE